MTLKQTNIDPAIIESEKIDGILNGFSVAFDAQGIALPAVKFWNGKQYVSGIDEKGEVIKDNVTDDSIRRVSIDLGDGKTRYFQQIDRMNGDAGVSTAEGYKEGNGLHATAWKEIDATGNDVKDANGKQEVRLSFTGFLGDKDTGALMSVIDGKLNPQALEAAVFTDQIIKQMGKDNISNIIYSSHSIGAGNALAAHVVSDLAGVPTKTALMIEPVGATLQLNKIQEAMSDSKSPFFEQLQQLGYSPEQIQSARNSLDNDVKNHVISIRAVAKEDGKLHGSAMGNVDPGVGVLEGLNRYYDSARKDVVPDGNSPESNKMLGKQILQDISTSLANPKAPINGVDPNHTLAMIAQNAGGNDVYYEVDHNNIVAPKAFDGKTTTKLYAGKL